MFTFCRHAKYGTVAVIAPITGETLSKAVIRNDWAWWYI